MLSIETILSAHAHFQGQSCICNPVWRSSVEKWISCSRTGKWNHQIQTPKLVGSNIYEMLLSRSFCFLTGLWCDAEETCLSDHSTCLWSNQYLALWEMLRILSFLWLQYSPLRLTLVSVDLFSTNESSVTLASDKQSNFSLVCICPVGVSLKPNTVSMGTETDSHLLVMSTLSLAHSLFARACLTSNKVCCELSVF